jgi:hypothetical protein
MSILINKPIIDFEEEFYSVFLKSIILLNLNSDPLLLRISFISFNKPLFKI